MGFLDRISRFFSSHLAMDLGTANTLIYMRGEGIVLNEPSVVAIDNNLGRVIAVGRQAKEYIGRTPPNISAIRPLKDGVIADFDVARAMIKYFLEKVRKERKVSRPKMVVGVPSGITQVEKKAVIDACLQVGVKNIYLIEEPMAAAIGSEMPIELPRGNMVVDIGGGTTEVAIISLSAVAFSESLRVAGDELDESIVRYLQKKHQISIGLIAAEKIKIEHASLYPSSDEYVTIVGKDILTGTPKSVKISKKELAEAVEEPVAAIVEAIKRTLEKLPPDFVSDLNESGMVLTGGGALLKGLRERIELETGISVRMAEDPLTSVVIGAGKTLEDMERYKRVFIN
ncbi:MAG: rod shape-determining protein [Desulfobacterota bacterium]|nr:rod shape-determining protein [Thermodesulfobacteriota bacterium]MDW8001958.1 rod shape-determining protein [Deltaproteobacteria bacterium]